MTELEQLLCKFCGGMGEVSKFADRIECSICKGTGEATVSDLSEHLAQLRKIRVERGHKSDWFYMEAGLTFAAHQDEIEAAAAALVDQSATELAVEVEKLATIYQSKLAERYMRERDDALARQSAMRSALERFLWWAQQQCPCENEEPNPCPLCGASVENLEACKAVEAKFPRDILAQARAALSEPETEAKRIPRFLTGSET